MQTILLLANTSSAMNSATWYILGGIISVAILVYLIYTLIKPEKF